MRVLVVGGTNFIGPRVIAALHRQGHEITVYHRGVHEADLPPGVRHLHSPHATVPVLHFPPSLSDPPPDVVLHMFLVGENDARAAVARFAGVAGRIVALSSGDVYRAYGRILGTEPGPLEPTPIREDAPLRQVYFPYRQGAGGPTEWTYHYDKILAERALLGSNLPTTLLRLPAVYGPGDQHRRFRPYIKRMRDGREVILIERLQAKWRWTHGYVDDVAHAIASATTNESTAGKVYNVGESTTPTMADRIKRMGELMGWTGSVVSVSRDRLPQHLRAPYEPTQDLVMDSSRIRAELGYQETVSEDAALKRTIAWEKSTEAVPGDPGPAEYAAEDSAAQSGVT
jgi:nucleoside-diphosphate-sugar epimerase